MIYAPCYITCVLLLGAIYYSLRYCLVFIWNITSNEWNPFSEYTHKKLWIISPSFFWNQEKTIDVDKHFQFKLWQTSSLMSLRRQRIRENIFNLLNCFDFWKFVLWLHVPYIVWSRNMKCYHGKIKQNSNFIVKSYLSTVVWM